MLKQPSNFSPKYFFESRDPFVIVRAKGFIDEQNFVEKVVVCNELTSFRQRNVNYIEILIAHGQNSMAMAVFLYNVLDVPVRF